MHKKLSRALAIIMILALLLSAPTTFAEGEPAAPITEQPPSESPTTEAPTTEAPTTEAPPSEAPTTEQPPSEAPITEQPPSEAPTTEAPPSEAPTTEAPPSEAPITEQPPSEQPPVETPGYEEWRGWRYVISDKGAEIILYIYGHKTDDEPGDEELTLPEKLGGEKVWRVGDMAFAGCDFIKRITFEDPEIEFGKDVFKDCAPELLICAPGKSTAAKYAADNNMLFEATDAPPIADPSTSEPPITDEPPTSEPPITSEPPTTEPPTTGEPPTSEPPTSEPPTSEPQINSEPPTSEPPITSEPPTSEPPTTDDPPISEPPTSEPPITSEPPSPGAVTGIIIETNFLEATLFWDAAGFECEIFRDGELIATVIENTYLDAALAPGEHTYALRLALGDIKGEFSADFVIAAAPPQAEKLVIAATSKTMGVGQKFNLAPYVLPAGAQATYRFTTSSAKIATVSATGEVTAKKRGKATITVISDTGLRASFSVKVVRAPSSVKASISRSTLGVGETAQMYQKISSSRAASFTYYSDNNSIATVDANGTVTARKPGKCRIYVKTHNGKKSYVKLTVKNAPTFITIPATGLIGVGQNWQIYAKINDGASTTVRYTSSDPSIASVTTGGKVTAKSPGECVITASTYIDGITCDCVVTVKNAPAYLSMGYSKLSLGVGEKFQLLPDIGDAATQFTYSTSKSSVAKVSSSGVITARKKGTAKITIKTHNGKKVTITVSVLKAPTSIRLNFTSAQMLCGTTLKMSCSLSKSSASGAITYTSSDEDIATVDSTGLVTARAIGYVTIKATTFNGKSSSCSLFVYDETYPLQMSIPESKIYVEKSGSYSTPLTILPVTADTSVTWTSSNSDIASVDDKGYVRARGRGRATISCKSNVNAGLSVNFTVIVTSDERTLTLPYQTTDLSGLSANMARINAVEQSALAELDSLRAAGTISESELNRRAKIIGNAFDMYAFPFMVKKRQVYWKVANSNGGKKDFLPGVVYYGMPYNSYGANREYNASKAVSGKYYTSSGKGYYFMNQSKYLNGKYVGNDCSSFVSMAIFGGSGSLSRLRTTSICTNGNFTTVSSTKDLRPGDLLCKYDVHVVMFLYYADDAKTQMVMIEQGGTGLYTNTIWTSITNISNYTNNGYIIRRPK